jgi:hypothetical protein
VAGEGGAVARLHRKLLFCSRGGTGDFHKTTWAMKGVHERVYVQK